MTKNKTILALLLMMTYTTLYAQEPVPEPVPQPDRPLLNRSGLYGKVVDSKTNKGLEAASVQLFAIKKDSVNTRGKDSLVAGMLTNIHGEFRFAGINRPDTFRIVASALGYADNQKAFNIPQGTDLLEGMELGNLKLAATSDVLSSVTVVAKSPTLQMGIDRKVFNVDKSLTSTGGTAIDVMRNIPSVSVDVDGNVLLRNTSPQVFVDGRPTILTLEQIPADDIEKIELITNPSAKFDASSSGGIINVVLKKNRRFGLNGIASAGIGTPQILTGNLSLNLRQGKFNFFATGSYNNRGGTSKGESKRQNKTNGTVTDYFNQVSETERTRRFKNIRFGADYFINNRNTLSLSQGFVNGNFDNLENQDQRYLDQDKLPVQFGKRVSDGQSHFQRSSSQLNYTHNFAKTGTKLTADLTYNSGTGANATLITNNFNTPDGTPLPSSLVRNSGENTNNQFTFQTDFEDPLTENSKLELGLRTFRQNNTNIFDAFALNNNTETKLPLSTNVQYSETVHAAYGTYSNKWKNITFQVGLRAEYSQFEGELVDSASHFGYKLPVDIGSLFDGLFPSLYLTREIGEGKEIQVNFSRRIRRPDFWQLNPFININDPLNISQGNPQLRPEYTNSFELNYNHKYEKGNFLGVLYFRNNDDDITRFSDTITAAQYEQLRNAGVDPNAILNTFINAQFTNRMGAEITVNQNIGNLEIIPNINLQYRKVKAIYGDMNLSNQGFNWEGKLILNYKLDAKQAVFNNMNFQLMTNYQSREVIPQGRNKEQFVSDFAVKKQFLKKNAASVTFAINDVFNTNKWGQIYDTENFYQDSYRRWNVRNFRVTFTYRFGSNDLDLFGSKQKKTETPDED